MSPLVAAAIGALTTISAVGGFLLMHAGAIKAHVNDIKKESAMVRSEIANCITAFDAFAAAVETRLAQPAPLSAEESAALAAAQARAVAATAVVSQPAAAQ